MPTLRTTPSAPLATRLSRAVQRISLLALLAIAVAVLRLGFVDLYVQPRQTLEAQADAALELSNQGMVDQQAALGGYVLTGDATLLDADHEGVSEQDQGNRVLVNSTQNSSAQALVAQLRVAQQHWEVSWATPALTVARPASNSFLQLGHTLFHSYQTAEASVAASLSAESTSLSNVSTLTLRLTLALELALAGLLVAVYRREQQALTRDVVQPVATIVGAIERIRQGGRDGVEIDGPAELQAIAAALSQTAAALASAEQARTESERALSINEARTTSYLEGIPLAVMVVTADGEVTFSNRAVETVMNRSVMRDRTSTAAERAAYFRLVKAGTYELYPADETPIARALHGEASMVDDIETLTGGRRPLRVWGVPILDDRGMVIAAMAVVSDITAERAAAATLTARAIELEHVNRDLGQFAYIASHDLQEPLRMVSSYVQLLDARLGPDLDADSKLFIGYAVEGVDRMAEMIQALLAFSRAGRVEHPEPVDTRAAVERAVGLLQRVIDEGGGTVTIEEGAMPTVMGSPTLVTELFQNLIGNGLKFHGAAPPSVTVSCRVVGGSHRFTVADTGIGIPVEHREQVFGMFKRLHGRATYPGSGIGLAICQRIVENLGGRIWVDASDGGGSAFRFTIPTPEEDETADGSQL